MKRTSRFVRIRPLFLAAAILIFGKVARTQETAPAPPPPPGPDVVYRAAGAVDDGGGIAVRAGGPDDAMVFVGFEAGLGGKTVVGAPFSATFSTEEKQVLADGNEINRKNSGNFARDSQGRTRRDMTFPGISLMAGAGQLSDAPHVVTINDPVAGAQYILEVDRKIARKMQFDEGGGKRERSARIGPGPGDLGPVITLEAQTEVRATTESLGTQTINGVLADGTRTTRTIPAGAIGNAKPIVITVERWYSPDLQTVVMMKRNDPRMGETTFQLTNIQRQEPDASLFQIPADYTVKQGRGGVFIRRMEKMDKMGPAPTNDGSAEPAMPPPPPEE